MKLRLLVFTLFISSLCAQESDWDVTLQVSPTESRGSFTSLQAAADKAISFAADGKSVRIQVLPGIYRQNVQLIGDIKKTYAPILIEGNSPEDTIITGADPFDGWELGDSTFTKNWPYEKNVVPHIFVEGARVAHTDIKHIGIAQSRFIDGGKRIEMLPPRNAVVAPGNVEVATRQQLLKALDITSLVINNIAFINGQILTENNTFAVDCQNIQKLWFEVVQIEANGHGLRIQQCKQVLLSGVDCERNRLSGAEIYWCENVHLRGGSFSLNGHDAATDGKMPAGLRTRKSKGLLIERTQFNENPIGLSVNFASGPSSIKAAQFYLNQSTAVELIAVDLLELQGGQLYGNADASLAFLRGTRGIIRNSFFVQEGGGEPLIIVDGSGSLSFNDNIVAAFDHKGPIFNFGGAVKLETAQKNLYYSSDTERAFVYKDDTLKLSGWQKATGLDEGSLFGDPLFTSIKGFDFSLKPASPWFQR